MHVRMQIKLCAKCKKEIQLRADIIPKKENIIFFFLILTVSCLYFGFFYIFIISFSRFDFTLISGSKGVCCYIYNTNEHPGKSFILFTTHHEPFTDTPDKQ